MGHGVMSTRMAIGQAWESAEFKSGDLVIRVRLLDRYGVRLTNGMGENRVLLGVRVWGTNVWGTIY